MKEIKQLLAITKALKEKYGKNFTLDGKLVGDIGEVLVAEKYGIKLYGENEPIYDGFEIATERKSSFKNYSYFPYGEVPDYFLSINISEEGEIEELFNGKGQFIVDNYITERKMKAYNNTYLRFQRAYYKD